MNKDNVSSQQSQNDEVDLGVLFNAIGKLFERLFNFIGAIFKFIFSLIVYASKAVIDNIKIIVIALVVAGVAGYALEKAMPDKYESKMLVRTFFDAKYQLFNNLEYYNSLIAEQNYETLSEIFETDESIVKEVTEFEMDIGPVNQNTLIYQYNQFLESLDTIPASDINFEDYVENRDILSGDLFEIRIETKKSNIFKDLETGILKSFENQYSLQKKKKRDSLLGIRKQTILNSIAAIDSLKRIYVNVLEEESKTTKTKINIGEGFPLQQEKSQTKEFDLLNKEIELRNQLRQLEEEKIEEDQFYEVISNFQEVGSLVNGLSSKYSLIFPILAFVLMSLVYLLRKYIRFVKSYEA